MAKDENDIERESELRKQLTEMEEKASELDRKRSENISVMTWVKRERIELVKIKWGQKERKRKRYKRSTDVMHLHTNA